MKGNVTSIKIGVGKMNQELSLSDIQKYLNPHFCQDLKIQVVERTDSSNLQLKKESFMEKKLGKVLIANEQTAAHGRFQRQYYTKKNAGIYMSMGFYGEDILHDIPNYTLLAAVAVIQTLHKLFPLEKFSIKWVNDIYLNNQKVCGILAESVWDTFAQKQKIIIGIGMNYSISPEDFPEILQSKATSLYPNSKPKIFRNQIIAEIINHFYFLLNQLPDHSYIDIYRQHSFVIGRSVSFLEKEKKYIGVAIAITEKGALVVKLSDGTLKEIHSGEISLQDF